MRMKKRIWMMRTRMTTAKLDVTCLTLGRQGRLCVIPSSALTRYKAAVGRQGCHVSGCRSFRSHHAPVKTLAGTAAAVSAGVISTVRRRRHVRSGAKFHSQAIWGSTGRNLNGTRSGNTSTALSATETLAAPEPPTSTWQLVEDPDSGESYYWNEETNETSWELPVQAADDETPAQESPTSTWQLVEDPDSGESYYWNKETNETSWELPVQVSHEEEEIVSAEETNKTSQELPVQVSHEEEEIVSAEETTETSQELPVQVSHEEEIVSAVQINETSQELPVQVSHEEEIVSAVQTNQTSRELPVQVSREEEIVPAEERDETSRELPVQVSDEEEIVSAVETNKTSRESPVQVSQEVEIVPAEERHETSLELPVQVFHEEEIVPAEETKKTMKTKKIKKTNDDDHDDHNDHDTGNPVDLCVDKLGMTLSDAQDVVDSCPALQERSREALKETLDFLLVELHPAPIIWREAVQRDPQLLASPATVLADALVWLEEFLWNQQWAVGFGRQALAEAIQNRPELLYCGEDAHFKTVSWLERHGVSDASISKNVARHGAVPFPAESYPWLDLLQLGAERLERAAVWCESDLGWTREEVAAALNAEPNSILAAATAAGASPGSPRPRYPLPTPASNWKFVSEAVGAVQ